MSAGIAICPLSETRTVLSSMYDVRIFLLISLSLENKAYLGNAICMINRYVAKFPRTYVSIIMPTARTQMAKRRRSALYLKMTHMFLLVIPSLTMPSESVVPEIAESM